MIRIEQFELRAPQVVALRLPRAGVIRVNAGRLWLTQSGRTEDVWLSPSLNRNLGGQSRILAQRIDASILRT